MSEVQLHTAGELYEARQKIYPREIQGLDGPTEIVELKSYCPKCRRSFFPGASPKRPR